MSLSLYNTLTQRKEPFVPAEPGHARIYVCGPTVQDTAHVGHARCYTIYDVLVRHLRASGVRVTYVRNVTDVDDKIIRKASETGETPRELSARVAQAWREDMARLGNAPPDVEPCVSDHLGEIIAMIEKLVAKGAAYPSAGDVYFRVSAFAGYGKLSHRKLDDMVLGGSGRTNEEEEKRKEHPADFALWKKSAPGEPSWPSPWGDGRPGWHIECSAMASKYLGESFDLHGGGLDLVFPHHENEIAQSEAASGKPFVTLWMHNGFVESSKEKMSKSLGNFFSVRGVCERHEAEAIRYYGMTVHYRSPLAFDWTLDESDRVNGFPQIEEAERRVEYVYRTRERIAAIPAERIADDGAVPSEISAYPKALHDALDDDLNMPIALAATSTFLKAVNELAEQASRKKGKVPRAALAAAQKGFAALATELGLGGDDVVAFLGRIRARRTAARGLTEADVDRMIQERIAARAAKDFAKADSVRQALADKGVELMDSPSGTTWRIP